MVPRKAAVTGKSALVREGVEKTTKKLVELHAPQAVEVVDEAATKDGIKRYKLKEPSGWVSAKCLAFTDDVPAVAVAPAPAAPAPAPKPVPAEAAPAPEPAPKAAAPKPKPAAPKPKPAPKAARAPTPKSKPPAWLEQPAFAVEGAQVRAWVHARSGCRLRLVHAAGPMANLYGVLATEATDCDWAKADDGLPHTLEHLVFLGSEAYPYKGVLDKLANRCLARGTNAWTDVDHTAYTVTTAGSAGLLALLPIYLDHVLRPTLTDAGFTTEVHHVTKDGEDKGVVYCEMQGRETTAESLSERACLGQLYGGTGYAAETGGICENLRALTNAQVRRYHADFYRASNLCLIVTGGVDADALLKVLDEALDASWKPAAAARARGLARPWSSAVPDAAPPVPAQVQFPSADEETGLVVTGWRANKYGDPGADTKTSLLWDYLADGAASPLAKKFVDGGLCSGVWPTGDGFRVGYRQVWFDDVAVDALDAIRPALDAALTEEAAKGVDAERMADVVARRRRKTVAACEDDPCGMVVSPVLKHFLYAEDRDETATLKTAADALALLDAAAATPKAAWDGLLSDLAAGGDKRAWVVARPSAARAAKQRDEEEARKVATTEAQGEAGLKKLGEDLDAACAENEKDIPEAMLACVPEPDLDEAVSQLFDVASAAQGPSSLLAPRGSSKDALELAEAAAAWLPGGPAAWALDHVDGTQFVRVDVVCDTRGLPARLREYLPLLSEVLFKAPTFGADGARIPGDDAVAALRRRTVSYGCGVGSAGGGTAWGFFVGAKLDRSESFAGGADVVRTALRQTDIWDAERLDQAVAKMSLELQSELRDGGTVARMALRSLVGDREADNGVLLSAAAQRAFLKKARFALSRTGRLVGARRAFLRDLGALALALFEPANVRARVAGDLYNGANGPSREALAGLEATPAPAAEAYARAARRYVAAAKGEPAVAAPRRFGRLALIGVGSLEGGSAYLNRAAPGPGKDDPLAWHAALAVALEYLNALEGDFWVKIRGAGLAYGASVRGDARQGLVHFSLYRSADPKGALDAAKAIVAGYASGATPVRPLDFTNARGSLASGLVEGEKTRSQALAGAWRRTLLGQDADRNRQYLKAVGAVSPSDALDALRTWVAPLFDDACANTAVACAPAKVAGLASGDGGLLDNAKLVEVKTYEDATLEELVGCAPASRGYGWMLGAAAVALVAVAVAKRRG